MSGYKRDERFPAPGAMKGVYMCLTSEEVAEYHARMLDERGEWSATSIELVYTVQAREATLRRLYRAVLATPLEGTELREAMKETERVLGITP